MIKHRKRLSDAFLERRAEFERPKRVGAGFWALIALALIAAALAFIPITQPGEEHGKSQSERSKSLDD